MNRVLKYAGALGLLLVSSAQADTIEMANGDVLNGKVVSLDAKQLVLKSELLGELKLAREKVSAIHLGDKPILPRNAAPVPAGKPPLDPNVQNVLNAVPSTEDVMKQLQGGRGGLNAQMVGELQTKFPLLNTPEAGQYFNDTLGGLMSGKAQHSRCSQRCRPSPRWAVGFAERTRPRWSRPQRVHVHLE